MSKRQQGSEPGQPEDDASRAYLMAMYGEKRERVWELHLRGVSNTKIAAETGLSRETIRKLLSEQYRQVSGDRKAEAKRKLDGAIARLRRIQAQAWSDHDEDDTRERHVLRTFSAQDEFEADGSKVRQRQSLQGVARFQSQRAQYLRVVLDTEREIARLEGLYDGVGDAQGVISIRIERVGGATTVIGDPESVEVEAETGE